MGAVYQWLLRDALQQYGELLESLGISIREAALRGSDGALAAHVRQARLVVLAAIDACKTIEKIQEGADGRVPS